MPFVEWVASLLVLPAVLVPALPPQAKEGWAGETVLVKRSATRYEPAEKADGPNPPGVGNALRSIEYRVLRDKGDKLVLMENGVEVLVNKDDVVLLADAVGYFTQEVEKQPTDSRAHAFRGWAYLLRGNSEAAVKDYSEAIRLSPNSPAWRNNRGVIYNRLKQYDKAIEDFDAAIGMNQRDSLALRNRAHARMMKKEYDKAVADFDAALKSAPATPAVHNSLAWILATCPDAKVRDGKRAVEAAKRACEMTKFRVGSFLDTLAAAHAEAGDFDDAVKYQQQALETGDFPKNEVEEARKRLRMFKEKRPYRLDEK